MFGGIVQIHTKRGTWRGVESLSNVQGLAIEIPEGIMMINELQEAVLDEEVRSQVDECHE